MIAFLGMGLLGSNFVKALLKRGEEVTVWNRTPGRTDDLEKWGAKVAKTPGEAVQNADCIHLTLKDDVSVDQVLEAAAPHWKPGAVAVDHTTTSVDGARQRAAHWASLGHEYLHAPVFMGPGNAAESTGRMIASGSPSSFAKVKTSLEKMTGTLEWAGDDTGRAASLKLLGNLLIVSVVGSLRDMLSLAKSLGVPTDEVRRLVENLNAGSMLEVRLDRVLTAAFEDPSWELQMARKDTELMMHEAQAANWHLAVIPAVAGVMDEWIARGFSNADWTVITKEVR